MITATSTLPDINTLEALVNSNKKGMTDRHQKLKAVDPPPITKLSRLLLLCQFIFSVILPMLREFHPEKVKLIYTED